MSGSAASFTAQLDTLLGQSAAQLGQPFTAYRIEATSSGDFPSAWTQIATNVLIYRTRITGTTIESAIQSSGTLWFQLVANMGPFLLGDVFVQSDGAYSQGVSYGAGATLIPGTIEFNGIALAWHPPTIPPVGARLNTRVGIYRPL